MFHKCSLTNLVFPSTLTGGDTNDVQPSMEVRGPLEVPIISGSSKETHDKTEASVPSIPKRGRPPGLSAVKIKTSSSLLRRPLKTKVDLSEVRMRKPELATGKPEKVNSD